MIMKPTFIKLQTLLAAMLLLSTLYARENVDTEMGSLPDVRTFKTVAANCDAASAQFDLDINNVRTRLLNGGDMWWNLSEAKYEVPKVDPPGSAPSLNSIFAGSIWISGKDEGGNLKIAAQTYRQTGNDFWAGPIASDGTVDKTTCDLYDRFFNVYGEEISEAIDAYNAGKPISEFPENVVKWPAKGNPHIVDDGFIIDDDLAPFYDNNNDGIYNPIDGDYPVINSNPSDPEGYSYADQMIFWVYNDVGNVHTETSGEAIGMQINALAFAFQTSDEINNMTFYRYNLVNKAVSPLFETYMSQWVDCDLGNALDDYIGCDTARSLGICYNADAVDDNNYGSTPPILGVDYFEGPKADADDGIDNDHDGLIDEGTDGIDNDGNGEIDDIFEQELLGMSSFVYYNNDFSATGNPTTASHFRNYQLALWKDGSCFTVGGTGIGGTVCTHYVYPSSPDDAGGWSECSVPTTPADRRFMQTSGPFTLGAFSTSGASHINNITVGVVWVRPAIGAYPCPNFSKYIGAADDKAQALFDNNFKVLDGPNAPTLLIRELNREVLISLVNKSTSNNVNESYDQVDPLIVALHLPGEEDTTYTFQGYKLYQLKDATVTAADLNDNSKARIVAQVDIKDGVGKLFNTEYDAEVEGDVTTLMVDGADEGIKTSFQIKTDLFATADPKLINFKTYYFAAVAYGYNYYDVLDTIGFLLDTATGNYVPTTERYYQKKPYLQGAKNFKLYSAIPHNSDPRNGGTVINAEFGDYLNIKRLEGQGNGGNELVLTPESVDAILANTDNREAVIEYIGENSPIKVKVVDPLTLKDDNYTLVMYRADSIGSANVLPGDCRWFIISESTGDTIYGQKNIKYGTEQILYGSTADGDIDLLGISVSLGQSLPYYKAGYQPGVGNVYGPLTSTVEFEDEEKPWLSFLKDDGVNTADNWIRTGDYNPQGTNYDGVWNSNLYQATSSDDPIFHDVNNEFTDMLSGTWAPYSLTANFWDIRGVGNPDAGDAKVYFSHGPSFMWNSLISTIPKSTQNNMDSLASVMIVLTPDKSKWSRCVVFETGEEPEQNEENLIMPTLSYLISGIPRYTSSAKGQLRSRLSLDKDGNEIASDTGRSWFPGYAINLENGERVNIAFGEASNLINENGADMLWNPTENLRTSLNDVLFGGKHYIYVFKTKYDECAAYQRTMLDNYNLFTGSASTKTIPADPMKQVYRDIIYTSIPYITEGYKLNSLSEGLIPYEVKILLHVDRPYERYETANSISDNATYLNEGLNIYQFSTQGLRASQDNNEVAKNALDLIRVVPNPYYAYSSYENSALDNRIKITNLPNECTIRIFSLDGKLVKTYKRDIPSDGTEEITSGVTNDLVNESTSIEWDLKNEQNIPIAGGVYLIHVEAPGIGEKTVKWFGALRPTDLDAF